MKLEVKVTAGPLKDSVFPLKNGLTIGRQGDIALEDSKASSIHARISRGEDKQWVLTDNNSKNGIRAGTKGDRVTTLALKPGVRFHIGESSFEIAQVARPIPEPELPPPPKPSKKQKYWHEILASFVGRAAANGPEFEDKVRPLSALEPALVLDFVRGAQVNSKWVLGFGPRKIGASSIDLPIWEPGAPATCFEIFPSADGLLFKTAYPQIVKLNGEAVDSRVLRMGDTIRILDTLIEVDFTA